MRWGLSGGQQQRLCIARTIALEPEIILMDEATSALDPISTQKMEELMVELKKNYTVIIVTHNMQQAARVADKTAFFFMGDLIEYGPTSQIFENPVEEKTKGVCQRSVWLMLQTCLYRCRVPCYPIYVL